MIFPLFFFFSFEKISRKAFEFLEKVLREFLGVKNIYFYFFKELFEALEEFLEILNKFTHFLKRYTYMVY